MNKKFPISLIISVCIINVIIYFLCVNVSQASELKIAGFAFAGDYGELTQRYPYLSDILDRKVANNPFFVSLRDKCKYINNSEFEITPASTSVDLKTSDQALISVLLITNETVLTENFGPYFRTFLNIRAEALIFDYKKKAVVRSYPISIILYDAQEGSPPDKLKIKNLIAGMLADTSENGLVGQYVTKISQAHLLKSGERTLQVGKVIISPEALTVFPKDLKANKLISESIIADEFASAISTKTGAPILPRKVGQAIGQVMSVTIANSDDVIKDIKIGDGDYLFEINLNKFIKIERKRTDTEVAMLYGALISLKFYEPISNSVYFDSNLKNGENSIGLLTKEQESNGDFQRYMQTLDSLFSKFAITIHNGKLDWLKASSSSGDIENQLKNTRLKILTSTSQ